MFGIIKTYNDAKRGMKDPAGFAKDLALDVIKAPLILFTFIGVLVLGFLFVFGWTNLIFSSLGIFKVLFFLIFIPFLILEIIFWAIFNKIKEITQKAKNRVDEEFKTIDAEIEK